MKSIPVALAGQYASVGATLGCCLKVERSDGEIFGFTDADHAFNLAGVTYQPGFECSDLSGTAGLGVDNLETTIVPDAPGGALTEADLLAGKWDNAKFTIFECNHLAPGDGINLLRRGTTGEATSRRDGYTLEFRSLKQALQQPVGAVTSKTCRARLGDEKCLVALGPWTNAYATTAVTSRRVVTCSAATEADDYYGEGIATGVTGPNAGYSQKVKSFAAGVFTLSLPMPFTIGVGDTFEFVAGCRKRLLEDCKAKFDNVLNFQGEPHVPGADLLTADPDIGGS